MTQEAAIYISEVDRERLLMLIKRIRKQNDLAHFAPVNRLEERMQSAKIVAPEDVPPDVVTMRSQVKVKDSDSGEEIVYSIVFPTEASYSDGRISILDPLTVASLGYKRGDTIEFQVPGRLRKLEIQEILYQPESAGDYDL